MYHSFTSGGQSMGVSALASFLPKISQGWPPSEWTGWISLQSKGLSRVFSNTTVQKHQFFRAQPSSQSNSHPYMTTWKTIALARWTFIGKVMSLIFNILSRLVITFLPRSKHLLEITSEMTQNKTHETDHTHTHSGWRNGTELPKLFGLYYYKAPLGRIPDCMTKPFQYSAGAQMLSYSKGSETPVCCRDCPEPFLPPYHKKGMFPRLQGAIKLKAVSRLLGRTPRLQAHSAQAESPVCRHISTFPIVAA